MENERAESSSTFKDEWTYDVFLSFRGVDTRLNFTGHLYNSLREKGIHTFMDETELRRGEEIKSALLDAIRNSRIAIIIFTKNYASSTYCLDELVEILNLLNAEGRLVRPVFYDVDPSQVRHQTGTYAEALEKHEKEFQKNKGKVQKWRGALREAAGLSGWHFQLGSESEYTFIQKIVEEVSKKINRVSLHVVDNPVDLDSAVLQVSSLLGLGSEVVMVGIYGFGGQGKTTIARAVYNLIADQFEGLCFLADIRETAISKDGLVQLQETLLSETLGEKDIRVGNVSQGIPIIRRRLQHMKVLLVLDDVDNRAQLKALAGGIDWFGSGSKIIITTRNKQLLNAHGVVRLHRVKLLSNEKALELFSWHAFNSNEVYPGYQKISNRVVSYARGLPLALEVIGSHLQGKSLDECNSALDKYEEIPHEDIHKILKVSFDGLGGDEKRIFLDIACFFNKFKLGYVKKMLHAHGFHAEDGLRVLVDRSLIKIVNDSYVRMHDLIQDMGREIVRQESTHEPGERSRLWFDEDIIHVLEENTGTNKVEVIKLGRSKNKVQWSGDSFRKMKNLRILIVEEGPDFSTCPKHLPKSLKVLRWTNYPSWSFPPDFNYKQLKYLHVKRITYVYTRHNAIYDLVCKLWLALAFYTSQLLRCNLQILFLAFLEQWKWLLCSLFLGVFRWKQRETLPPLWPWSLFLGYFRWKKWQLLGDLCQLMLMMNLHRSIIKVVSGGYRFVDLRELISISFLLSNLHGVWVEDLLLISISFLLVKVLQSQVLQRHTSLFLGFFWWTLHPVWPWSLFLGYFGWKKWWLGDLCQLMLTMNLHRSIIKVVSGGHRFVDLQELISISFLLAKLHGVRLEDLLLLISISFLLVKVLQSQVLQRHTYPIGHRVLHARGDSHNWTPRLSSKTLRRLVYD